MYFTFTFMEPNNTRSLLRKNTWSDWFLIPTERPVIAQPSVKTNYIDLKGADGQIDATEFLTGYPTYGTRSGSWDFIVDNDHARWIDIHDQIVNYLHGRRKWVAWDEDAEFYYSGRFSVNSWKSEQHNSKITIDYVLDPYKIALNSAASDWLWDPFNFETGIITNSSFTQWTVDSDEYATFFESSAFTAQEIMQVIGTKPVVPKVTVILESAEDSISLRFYNLELNSTAEYTIGPGAVGETTVTIPEFVITNSVLNNLIKIEAKGHGTITKFDFAIGRL